MKIWEMIIGMLMVTATLAGVTAYYDYDTFTRADNTTIGSSELLHNTYLIPAGFCGNSLPTDIAILSNNKSLMVSEAPSFPCGFNYNTTNLTSLTFHQRIVAYGHLETGIGYADGGAYCIVWSGGGFAMLSNNQDPITTNISFGDYLSHDVWVYYDSESVKCKYKIDSQLFDNGGMGYDAEDQSVNNLMTYTLGSPNAALPPPSSST
jgi:hypothetical protein